MKNSYFFLWQYSPEVLKYVNFKYQAIKRINWKQHALLKDLFQNLSTWCDYYLCGAKSIYRSKYPMRAVHFKTVLTVLLPAILEKGSVWTYKLWGKNPQTVQTATSRINQNAKKEPLKLICKAVLLSSLSECPEKHSVPFY